MSSNQIEVGHVGLDYNRKWGLGELIYEVGDIVTRFGDDRHKILSIDYWIGIMEVECIRASEWISVGEVESNLIRRYQLIAKHNNKN